MKFGMHIFSLLIEELWQGRFLRLTYIFRMAYNFSNMKMFSAIYSENELCWQGHKSRLYCCIVSYIVKTSTYLLHMWISGPTPTVCLCGTKIFWLKFIQYIITWKTDTGWRIHCLGNWKPIIYPKFWHWSSMVVLDKTPSRLLGSSFFNFLTHKM